MKAWETHPCPYYVNVKQGLWGFSGVPHHLWSGVFILTHSCKKFSNIVYFRNKGWWRIEGRRHVGRLSCKWIKNATKTLVATLIYLVWSMSQLLQNSQWKVLIRYEEWKKRKWLHTKCEAHFSWCWILSWNEFLWPYYEPLKIEFSGVPKLS